MLWSISVPCHHWDTAVSLAHPELAAGVAQCKTHVTERAELI